MRQDRSFGCMYIALLLALWGTEMASARPQVSIGRLDKDATRVSLIDLIVNQESLDRTKVAVQGVLSLEEGAYICLSRDDARYFIAKNCIAVDWDLPALGTGPEAIQDWHLKYVYLVGRFRKDFKGMWGTAAGGIDSVSRVDLHEIEYSTHAPEASQGRGGAPDAVADPLTSSERSEPVDPTRRAPSDEVERSPSDNGK